MKRSHRRSHALLWLALLPILVVFIYYAEVANVSETPRNPELVQPSAAGVLP